MGATHKKCVGHDDDGTPCKSPVIAKGTCFKHYQRMRIHGSLELPPKIVNKCSVKGCSKKYYGKGYCQRHLNRWKRTGDPLQGTREQHFEKIKAQPVTCKVICKGLRCGIKIGRGHGDGKNHKGSVAREYCGTHDARWRAHGDVRADDPILIQRERDAKRPPCAAPDCEKEARGWQGSGIYCDAHRLLSDRHGRLHVTRQHNIGLTCSVKGCDKVCGSGADKFIKGMCPTCYDRLKRRGTTELSHLMLKRKGIWRTCSIEGCDENETGETLLCKRHWDQQYRKRTQSYRNARTRIYRAKKQGADSDYHSIAELQKHWKEKGIDPKRCTYCDAWYRQWKNNWKNSVGDHVYPISKGGTDTMDNLVPCCTSCNSSKGDRILYEEWIPPKERIAA